MEIIQATEIATQLRAHMSKLEDPRTGPAQLHELQEIMIIAICAILCGANYWTEVEAYGKAKEAWLRTFLELEHGIPSHDTFNRVFRHLDPVGLEACFREWTREIHVHSAGEVIPIDGKCLRGSHDRGMGKEAIYVVSAWASQNHLVLGQGPVGTKSNEITAIPELIKKLDITECIVSIDAIGTQKEIAQQIVTQAGDYVLALKQNQPHLLEDVQSLFTWADNMGYAAMHHAYSQTINKGHGRVEVRECWTLSDPTCIAMLDGWQNWSNLKTVARVRSQRHIGAQNTTEERYYISSLPDEVALTAERVLTATRSHWAIENQLHWVLDMAFREDECRVRKGHGDENLAVLRHITLNLLQGDKNSRIGVHGRRLKAGWDSDYLAQLLGVQMR